MKARSGFGLVMGVVALGLSGLGLVACSKADKGDEGGACSSATKSSEVCGKCCKEAGSMGHMWTDFTPSTCKCL